MSENEIENMKVSKGLDLLESGRYEEAIKEFNAAIELNPKDPDYHNNKGIALESLGRYEEAIKEYNAAIELNPKYPDYHNNKGIALFKSGRYEEAIKEFDAAIELDPKDPDYHNVKGFALKKLGEYEEAIKQANMAIKLNPKDPINYLNYAEIMAVIDNEYEGMKRISDAMDKGLIVKEDLLEWLNYELSGEYISEKERKLLRKIIEILS
ncbi:tetratricopeptide repeat protein [Caldiplasma sukawensis]